MNYDVSKVILFDRNNKLLIYLRDDKPTIPYPNIWDLLGGGIEPDESAKQAAIREVEEEIGVTVDDLTEFGRYVSEEGFRLTIFSGQVDAVPEELVLTEGQKLISIDLAERGDYQIVPTLSQAIDDFVQRQS